LYFFILKLSTTNQQLRRGVSNTVCFTPRSRWLQKKVHGWTWSIEETHHISYYFSVSGNALCIFTVLQTGQPIPHSSGISVCDLFAGITKLFVRGVQRRGSIRWSNVSQPNVQPWITSRSFKAYVKGILSRTHDLINWQTKN